MAMEVRSMLGKKVAVVAWCAGVVAAVALDARPAQESVKIGVQLPLSGERSAVGRAMKSGIAMAVETVNRADGIGGVPLEVVYVDDRDTEQGAIDALRILTRQHQVVAVIGELFSRYVIASREVVEQEQVPYLSGATSPRATEQTGWIFRVGASDALLADLLARYVVEDLRLKRLSVLHDRTGIHNARADLLVKVLQEKYGIAPLVRVSWKPGDRDFRSQLEQANAKEVEAILALGETGEGGPFLRQVKELKIPAQVVAHRDFGARQVLEEAGEAAEGTLIVSEYLPALQDQDRRAWARSYQARYGTDANVIAAQYHDALLLVAEAARRAGPGRAEIRSGLTRLRDFRGAMADYTFDEKRNGVHRFDVARITNGMPALVASLRERP
jgi:branched-chain amino acid transport system substrate-binding protein